jgi:protease-4
MKKFVVGILAIIGSLSILSLMFLACVGTLSMLGTESLPGRMVLEIDFEQGVIESIPADFAATVMLEGTPELRDLVDAIDKASGDRRVAALVARIGGGGIGLAHLQELRDAVSRFRNTGKPAYAFAETFGEFGPGNGGYYLATAFDRIYLQPSGDIGLTGLMYESMFVRGLLDKLDVTPRMAQRHEYKNAMNMYTEREFTEPHREAMQAIADSQFDQIVRGIAEARGLSDEETYRLFDRGPFLGEEALTAGLVDELAYRDVVYDKALSEAGKRAVVVAADDYLEGAGRPDNKGTTIALIQGHGTVARGESSFSPVNGSMTMGSDTVAAAFRDAIDDRRVEAIIFRVDSPGGSYVASDTIRRETARAREADKPVIVSMGNLAGSGGYFVAMDAERIVAQPGTITASIGVLGGKLVTRGLWSKFGISWDDVQTSNHAGMWSPRIDYDEDSWARFEAALDRIYTDFTNRVAIGREMPLEDVQQIAKGRIWTGQQAIELGLVDELGGLDVAKRLARESLELDADAPIRLKRFPPPLTQWEMLFSFTGTRANLSRSLMVRTLVAFQPTMRVLQRMGYFDEPGVLSLPEIGATP